MDSYSRGLDPNGSFQLYDSMEYCFIRMSIFSVLCSGIHNHLQSFAPQTSSDVFNGLPAVKGFLEQLCFSKDAPTANSKHALNSSSNAIYTPLVQPHPAPVPLGPHLNMPRFINRGLIFLKLLGCMICLHSIKGQDNGKKNELTILANYLLAAIWTDYSSGI